ncbi:MAG: hypothetical protein IPJ40_12095 [Saprospirales bacterium]|nr:hypothetical protein [Saprospirales bacterium]
MIFPSNRRPPTFATPAPCSTIRTGGGWTSPWADNDPRPLVVVSLSSTFQNQAQVIQHAIHALGGLDVRGLVTLGPAIDPNGLDVPENVVVMQSAPIPRCSLRPTWSSPMPGMAPSCAPWPMGCP